jgi:hypothetical protein
MLFLAGNWSAQGGSLSGSGFVDASILLLILVLLSVPFALGLIFSAWGSVMEHNVGNGMAAVLILTMLLGGAVFFMGYGQGSACPGNARCPCSGGCLISSVQLIGSAPVGVTCNSTGGEVYSEQMSITGTTNTVTTETLGLKIIPTYGGLAVNVSTPGAWTAGSAGECPTNGWWGELVSAGGSPLAWYQSSCSDAYSEPCWSANQDGTSAVAGVTISGGQFLMVYMIGQHPADPNGNYTMQAYGLGGDTVSGSVDL